MNSMKVFQYESAQIRTLRISEGVLGSFTELEASK